MNRKVFLFVLFCLVLSYSTTFAQSDCPYAVIYDDTGKLDKNAVCLAAKSWPEHGIRLFVVFTGKSFGSFQEFNTFLSDYENQSGEQRNGVLRSDHVTIAATLDRKVSLRLGNAGLIPGPTQEAMKASLLKDFTNSTPTIGFIDALSIGFVQSFPTKTPTPIPPTLTPTLVPSPTPTPKPFVSKEIANGIESVGLVLLIVGGTCLLFISVFVPIWNNSSKHRQQQAYFQALCNRIDHLLVMLDAFFNDQGRFLDLEKNGFLKVQLQAASDSLKSCWETRQELKTSKADIVTRTKAAETCLLSILGKQTDLADDDLKDILSFSHQNQSGGIISSTLRAANKALKGGGKKFQPLYSDYKEDGIFDLLVDARKLYQGDSK